eukprot:8968146-Alexandrium_andersonii.AAC.1
MPCGAVSPAGLLLETAGGDAADVVARFGEPQALRCSCAHRPSGQQGASCKLMSPPKTPRRCRS